MCRYIIIAIVSLVSLQVIAADHHSVLELLDRYAETQDKLQSIIVKSEDSMRAFMLHEGKRIDQNISYITEVRWDGYRANVRTSMWGNVHPNWTNVSKDKPFYTSTLFDGKSQFGYGRGDVQNVLGTLTIDKSHPPDYEWRARACISRGSKGHDLMGFFYGDDGRVDSVLRQAQKISVEDKMEQLDGSLCYVVNAVTNRGKYRIWIDPEHGYNIAKAHIQKRQNDFYANKGPLKKGEDVSVSLNNVRFTKIDGVWVPMEGDIEYVATIAGMHAEEKIHHKRTEVILNPDHDSLGSFVPDDIKNGAKVLLVTSIGSFPNIIYTWHDGKVVDENGRRVDLSKIEGKS